MKHLRSIVPAICAVMSCAVPAAWAQAADTAQPATDAPATRAERLVRAPIESAAGMDLIVSRTTVAPGSKSESHSHPGETFVYILSGRILNQIGDEEPQVFEAGDFFFEPANARHARFENPDPEISAVVIIYGIRPKAPN